jgi:hypothetical protein
MPTSLTQVLLANPRGLRIEFRLDDATLRLWWSPCAGDSFDSSDRNFSSRDDHLDVFARIDVENLPLDQFLRCDYDAYRAVLHYEQGSLTLATAPDAAVLRLSATFPLIVNFKTGRYDARLAFDESGWLVSHVEPAGRFEFSARLGPGEGRMRHQAISEKWRSFYARVEAASGQALVIGVGLEGDEIDTVAKEGAALPAPAFAERMERRLADEVRTGLPTFRGQPRLAEAIAATRRSLHSCIDDSGAVRAALKEVYYLIWIRDAAFSFNYQAASGWLHRHAEWCQLLFANPLTVDEPGVPRGRTFGQLISRTFGKLEEDGLYYAVWSAFTHWVQTGNDRYVTGPNLALLEEALTWVENYIFDEGRGLFGQRLIDESPMRTSRDNGWDAAIGRPGASEGVFLAGKPAARSFDIYINLLMLGTYRMLAALPTTPQAAAYRLKAENLWKQLGPLLTVDGLPAFGEMLMEDGTSEIAPAFTPKTAIYVWALSLPTLAPIPHIDAIRLRVLHAVMAAPRMHWNNSLAVLVAAIDPLQCDEAELLAVLHALTEQALKPGKYLPMGGALTEKFDAEEGAYYDDIRPQAFAQASFLAAAASLGVRRLPFGLAVRPTQTLTRLDAYAWRDAEIDFVFPTDATARQLVVNGIPLPHSWQIPDTLLEEGSNTVTWMNGTAGSKCVWVSSNLRLLLVTPATTAGIEFSIEAFGSSEAAFLGCPGEVSVSAPETSVSITQEGELWFVRFDLNGPAILRIKP